MPPEPPTVYVAPDVAEVLVLYDGLVRAAQWPSDLGEHIERLAQRLLDGHRAGHRGAVVEQRNWRAGCAGLADDAILARPLDLQDAREVVARGHGFDGLGGENPRTVYDALEIDPDFERAVDAVTTGDLEVLASLLADRPDLPLEVSRCGHGATLLGYLPANAVETYRQTVPSNAADVAETLLRHGARRDVTLYAYGRNCSLLELLASSDHPKKAGVTEALAQVLRST